MVGCQDELPPVEEDKDNSMKDPQDNIESFPPSSCGRVAVKRVSTRDMAIIRSAGVVCLVVAWAPWLWILAHFDNSPCSAVDIIALLVTDLTFTCLCAHYFRMKSVYLVNEFVIIVGAFSFEAIPKSALKEARISKVPVGIWWSWYRVAVPPEGQRKKRTFWFVGWSGTSPWKRSSDPVLQGLSGGNC